MYRQVVGLPRLLAGRAGSARGRHHVRSAAGGSQLEPAVKGSLTPELQSYVSAHVKLSQVQEELRKRTEQDWPRAAHMMVPVEEGQFLAWIVGTLRCRRAIELGTFTGYSALLLAEALPEDGRLVVCEHDARPLTLAMEHWKKAGVAQKIDIQMGPALDTLQHLLDAGEADTFDFAFIDADKRKYFIYYELLLRLVKVGGVIAADNILWYGRVADIEDQTPKTQALREFNSHVCNDARVSTSLAPIGDGLLLIRRCQ